MPTDITFTKMLLAFALFGMMMIVVYDSIITPGKAIPDIVISTFGGIIGWLINSQGSQQSAHQTASLQKTDFCKAEKPVLGEQTTVPPSV